MWSGRRLFAAGLALYGKRWFPKVVLVGALVSARLMALLFPSRYRPIAGLFRDRHPRRRFVGWIAARLRLDSRPSLHPPSARRKGLLTIGAFVSLAALVLCTMFASEYGTFLYQGGFLLVALLSALLVATASHPGGAPGKVLGWAPLVWLGVRSYAIYLWHWPVFMLTRPHIDVPFDGPGLFAGRLAITLLLADISYRLIEQPFRPGLGAAAPPPPCSAARRRRVGALHRPARWRCGGGVVAGRVRTGRPAHRRRRRAGGGINGRIGGSVQHERRGRGRCCRPQRESAHRRQGRI